MESLHEAKINQDLRILFRHVPKSSIIIILTVTGFVLIKSSNDIKEIQIHECSKNIPFSFPLFGKHFMPRCSMKWMKIALQNVFQCKFSRDLPYIADFTALGKCIAFCFGYKSDQGSPKNIILRALVVKTVNSFVNIAFRGMPDGVIYLHNVVAGYAEGAVMCAAQTLIGRWTTRYFTLFSSLIQLTYVTSRMFVTPVTVSFAFNTSNGRATAIDVQVFLTVALGILTVMWRYLVFDKPSNHAFITKRELKNILRKTECAQAEIVRIPWKKIWTNKHYLLYLFVRSMGLFQYLFWMRTMGAVLCTVKSKKDGFGRLKKMLTLATIIGAVFSSMATDIITRFGISTKSGARKTFFFLFVIANVPYYFFYLNTIEYIDNFMYKESYVFLVISSLFQSFYFASITSQHFDLSSTFAASQASIVFLVGELVMYLDRRIYEILMVALEHHMSKYLLLYWLALIMLMIPTMMVNTCFNSFSTQEFNKCTRNICKKELEYYPANLIYFK